jgi:methanogenic corrinoid protein MtbC1
VNKTLEQKQLTQYLLLLSTHLIDNDGAFMGLLHEQLNQRGIAAFLADIAVPLSKLVGQLWVENKLSVFTEHAYTSQMTQVLNDYIFETVYDDQTRCLSKCPRIVLASFLGEKHVLGLTMTQALLLEKGAYCLNLGAELPVSAIVGAAKQYRADVVGLTISETLNKRLATALMTELHQTLPDSVEIWVGGNGAYHHASLDYITLINNVPSCIEAYQALAKRKQSSP